MKTNFLQTSPFSKISDLTEKDIVQAAGSWNLSKTSRELVLHLAQTSKIAKLLPKIATKGLYSCVVKREKIKIFTIILNLKKEVKNLHWDFFEVPAEELWPALVASSKRMRNPISSFEYIY